MKFTKTEIAARENSIATRNATAELDRLDRKNAMTPEERAAEHAKWIERTDAVVVSFEIESIEYTGEHAKAKSAYPLFDTVLTCSVFPVNGGKGSTKEQFIPAAATGAILGHLRNEVKPLKVFDMDVMFNFWNNVSEEDFVSDIIFTYNKYCCDHQFPATLETNKNGTQNLRINFNLGK